MYTLELSIGKEPFRQAMQAYFAEWKGRHPYPEDLKASLEKSTGMGLTALFELLNKKGNF
jgi:aminopeptidase N